MVEQKEIIIGDVKVPIIIEDGITYYPISYLSEKVLLRQNFIEKKRSQYDKYEVLIFEIKFGEKNTQMSNCIPEHKLKERLSKTQESRLSEDQIIKQNDLHKILGIRILSKKIKILEKIPDDCLDIHDDYTRKLIDEYKTKDTKYQLCNKCDRYFPLDSKFFHLTNRAKTGYFQICQVCEGKIEFFQSDNVEINRIRKVGVELYKSFTEDKLIDVYKAYIEGKIRFLPDCYSNKESYLEIIKWLNGKGMLLIEELSMSYLYKVHRFTHIASIFTTNEIHFELFGENSYYYPWKYPNIQRGKVHSFELARIEFNNYLEEYKIDIYDKFTFKYHEIVVKAKIRLNDLLGFVVYYHDYSDAGYKYSVAGSNYYKKDKNVIFDLKYLIEVDMKIDLNKIPLYLTKTSLRKNADPLYNYIVHKKNGNIFEWINKIYPDKFNELDFDVNYYREVFDSIEEGQIHELLVSELRSVIYNGKIDNRRLFIIEDMEPDWIALKDDKCWIIEYFGMYLDSGGNNSTTKNYYRKTKLKIEKYEKLDYYGKIYFYPDDLKNNFEGIKNKIAILK